MDCNYWLLKLRIVGVFLFTISCYQNGVSQSTNENKDLISSNSDSSIYTIVPTMPEFGHHPNALLAYIYNEAVLKVTMTRNDRTKPVFAQIIIEKDGSVTFDRIEKGYAEKYDNEAKRIIEKMPKWSIPLLEDGTPARVYLLIPFWFR